MPCDPNRCSSCGNYLRDSAEKHAEKCYGCIHGRIRIPASVRDKLLEPYTYGPGERRGPVRGTGHLDARDADLDDAAHLDHDAHRAHESRATW